MHRQFWAICGTPMFTQAETRKHTIGVRALDEPDLGKPQITIWTSSAPNWACFDPNPICRARRKAALHLLQHRHQTPELAVAPHDGGPEKTNGAALARGSGVYANAIPPNVCLLTAAEFPAFR